MDDELILFPSYTCCDTPVSTVIWNNDIMIRTPLKKHALPSMISETRLKQILETADTVYSIKTRDWIVNSIGWESFLQFLHYDCITQIDVSQSYMSEIMMKRLIEVLEIRTFKKLVLGDVNGYAGLVFLKYLSSNPMLKKLQVERGKILFTDAGITKTIKTNYTLEVFEYLGAGANIILERCKINKWNRKTKKCRMIGKN